MLEYEQVLELGLKMGCWSWMRESATVFEKESVLLLLKIKIKIK